MLFFSYHNGIPAPLPLPLQGASLESLFDIGYSGPFPAPVFDARRQEAQWTGSEWQIVDLSAEQLLQRDHVRLLGRANWTGFSEALMGSTSYQKARAAAATSLQANVDCTELIAFLADARIGRPYIAGINTCFASIDNELDLTEEDKAELYQLGQNFSLSTFLIVPNYEPPSGIIEGNGEGE
jgi:hypothetical protein